MPDETPKDPGLSTRGIVTAAMKSGMKAVTGARGVWSSKGARRLRGGVRTVVGGLAGVTRFVRTNTIRGLLSGEIIIRERDLNRWVARVTPPDAVSHMSLRCRPSRLVLSLEFERKLLGVRIAKTKVDLPFDLRSLNLSAEGGEAILELDEDALTPARGFLQPIMVRLLSRAAADLLDGDPLDEIDDFSDLIDRDGNIFTVHLGDYPPLVDLMHRELRLPGGTRLLPLHALQIHDATVEEGQLIIHVRYDRDRILPFRDFLDLEPEDEEETIEVTILELNSDSEEG